MSVLFLIGKTLGKYQIIEHIGHGGMAEVYKARHIQLDRMVAIKVLHPFLADESGFVARFRREAKIVATLRHQNIVRVYDFDRDEDLDIYYMVMEYIEGESLKQRLANGPLPLGEALSITAAIADALDYAHQRGMVHRDIKPANILFTTENVPVLTDFGIARMLSVTGLTASGAMVGTPAYMAPEVGMGDPGSVASDVYSLGVVLFEMLTGRPPFIAETPMGVIMQHINEPAPSLSQFIAHPLPALDSVLQRCLAKKPEARYASARELAQHLRTLMSNAGLLAESGLPPEGVLFVEDWAELSARQTQTPTTPSQTHELTAGTEETTPPASEGMPLEKGEEEKETPTPPRALEEEEAEAETVPAAAPRRRWGWLIGLLVLLATLGGGLGWAWQSGQLNAWLGSHPLPFVTPTPVVSVPPPASPEPTITPTPTPPTSPAECRYQAMIEKVEVRPASKVPLQTPLVAYVTLRNTGTCALAQVGRLVLTSFAGEAQPQILTVGPLAAGAYQHFILELPTPDAAGIFTHTLRASWTQPVALQSVYTFTYQADPTLALATPLPFVPTPTPDLTYPLTARAPLLVFWSEDLTQNVWFGTLRLQATGGTGTYQYFIITEQGEKALPGAELQFSWPRCQDFPLTVRILAGREEVFWNGRIAYPYAERCQP